MRSLFLAPGLCFFEGRSSNQMDFGVSALATNCFMPLGPRSAYHLPTKLAQGIDQFVCGNVCGTHTLNYTGRRKLHSWGQLTGIGYTYRCLAGDGCAEAARTVLIPSWRTNREVVSAILYTASGSRRRCCDPPTRCFALAEVLDESN